MPYNQSIDRTGASALIPEEVSRTIVQNVPQRSTVLRMAQRLPNMTRKQTRMPVLSSLPSAYFVNGDTGQKQTTKLMWDNKYIYAEELAVIVPIPEAVLDDADYDIWGQIRPLIDEALGVAFDRAVFFGENAPDNYPDDLLTAATAAGNTVTIGTNADLYDDLLGTAGLLAKIESDGFNVTGHIADLSMKAKLRGLRDANGVPIFTRNVQTATPYDLDSAPIDFPENGSMDATKALMFSGNFRNLVYSMRQDVTYKMLDQAVIQDTSGNTIFNLAQQDMVALRVVMRLGWQVPNPINRVKTVEANRYPFGVLLP